MTGSQKGLVRISRSYRAIAACSSNRYLKYDLLSLDWCFIERNTTTRIPFTLKYIGVKYGFFPDISKVGSDNLNGENLMNYVVGLRGELNGIAG